MVRTVCTLLVTLIVAMSGVGCMPPVGNTGFKSINTGYYAIDPIELWIQQPTEKDSPEEELSKSRQALKTLTSIGTVTTQNYVSGSGEINAPAGSGSAAAETLVLYSDNLLYRIIIKNCTITLNDGTTKTIPISLVIGVGSRIHGVLNIAKGNVNISGVPGFGLSGNVSVQAAAASVHTIGIISDTLIKMPRFSGEISKDNMYTFFQNLSLINSEITSDDTRIVPHVMGFHISDLDANLAPAIVRAIRAEAAEATDYNDFVSTSLTMRRSRIEELESIDPAQRLAMLERLIELHDDLNERGQTRLLGQIFAAFADQQTRPPDDPQLAAIDNDPAFWETADNAFIYLREHADTAAINQVIANAEVSLGVQLD